MSQSTFENEVIDRLARIETTLKAHIESTSEDLEDHESRLRAIETENRLARGAFLFLTLIMGWFGYHLNFH